MLKFVPHVMSSTAYRPISLNLLLCVAAACKGTEYLFFYFGIRLSVRAGTAATSTVEARSPNLLLSAQHACCIIGIDVICY